MKALVTGGAGFIGSNLVDRLVSLNHEVVVVDNLLTGSRENLNPKAKFYESDITNFSEMEKIFECEKPKYVFHLAAGYLVQSLDNPQRDASTNVIGTINLALLCLKSKVDKIIYSNSGGASYGEPQSLPLTEEHPINPLTPYGISKHTAEHYLYMYQKNHGLNYTSLRYANIYGPRQNPKLEGGVISIFIDSLLKAKSPSIFGDGKQTRDYCYVDDVVDANLLAMEKGNCTAYHVATGVEISVLDLFSKVSKIMGLSIPPIYKPSRVGDCRRAVFDITKIKNELGWEPKTSLEEGILKTLNWQKSK